MKLQLSCRKATELISLSQDRPLTLVERGRLRLHLAICIHCTRFSQQMGVLRRVAQELPEKLPDTPAE